MTDLLYANEKYGVGIYTLAIADGSLRHRLRMAFRDSVMRAYSDQPGGGPPIDPELLERMRLYDERMTSGPDLGDGTIDGTVQSMTDDEVRDAAEEMWNVAGDLRRALSDHWVEVERRRK